MKKKQNSPKDELRPEYDLAKLKNGITGKYYDRYRKGTNLILLDPDVAKAFSNAKAVNNALRALMQVAKKQVAARA